MKKIHFINSLLIACISTIFISGCCSLHDQEQAPKPKPKPAPSVVQSSQCITIDKVTPQESLIVGQQYKYEINLVNSGCDCGLTDVVLTEEFGNGFKFIKSVPAPNSLRGGTAVWNFGDLDFNESRKVTVWGSPKGTGTITNCAKVTYNRQICNTVTVVQPKLKLEKFAPREVLLCDIIPVTLNVCNTGTGTINHVTVTDKLPKGLIEAKTGKTEVSFTVESLPAGKCQKFQYHAKPLETGSFKATAKATSHEKLTDSAATLTTVRQPILKISKMGDSKEFIGRPYSYTIAVSNVGDASAKNLRIVDTIPAGAKCTSLSKGGAIQGNNIVWSVNDLKQKTKVTCKATFVSATPGNVVNRVMASADCAKAVTASAQTKVIGIPAILLEVIDLDDPIAVNGEETYVVTVTNQGSATDTNIKINCELEDSQKFISGSGPTAVKLVNGVISCDPYPELPPKAKVTWRIKVRALKAGDVRFKAKMNSDQLSRPVQETEATNQY